MALGGPKARALLAFLLVHRNQVVSRERLVDALWGERPPHAVAAELRVYVAKLRKALRPELLVTHGEGYALVLGDQLDAERFEQAAREGSERLAAGDAEAAASILGEALALWRGGALGDLASDSWAQGEAGRLEELRLTALEERLEADLALGRHANLVAELEQLVAEQPYRERLRAQLMLALYRSGRQADALAIFQDARRSLVGDLGLEPSRELQALEGAILNQDPALAPTLRRSPRAPSNLPATIETGTIVCADIEAFTPFIQELAPEEFGGLIADLHRIMQTTLKEAAGHEVVVFADSAIGVFRSARAAVAAALRLQEAIASHRWPGGRTLIVNIALHSGEVVATRDGYFGLAVNHVWAISESKAAHGGRILVSDTTKGLLDGSDLVLRPCPETPMPFPLFELIGDRSADAMAATRSHGPDLP